MLNFLIVVLKLTDVSQYHALVRVLKLFVNIHALDFVSDCKLLVYCLFFVVYFIYFVSIENDACVIS